MTEKKLEGLIMQALDFYNEELGEMEGDSADIINIRTFEEAGVLTSNKGLVISIEGGREFQLTIVQSR